MSLLLKALQKSQAERHQASLAMPLLYTRPADQQNYQPAMPAASQGTTIIHSGGNSAWLAVVLGCNMMLVIVMAFFWLQGNKQQPAITDTLVLQALSRELSINDKPENPPAASLEPVEKSLAESLLSTVESARSNLIASVQPQPKPAIVRLDSVAEPAPLPEPSRKIVHPSVSSPVSVNPTKGFASSKVYEVHELDQQLLAGFPELDYNAHLYSPDLPSARMFMANDARYVENDRIDTNTKVEAIVSDGVVFNFKGIRVKINVVDKLQ